MTQQATLRDIDSQIVSQLITAGLGDLASYTPPGGGASTDGISVLKDQVYAEFGDDAGAVGGIKTVITFYLSEVPVPVRGAVITIGARTYKLDQLDAQDDSMSRWVVV